MNKFIKLMIAGISPFIVWTSASAEEPGIDYQTAFIAQQVSITEIDSQDLTSSKWIVKDENNNILFEAPVEYSTQYAATALRVRTTPTIDSEPFDTLYVNDEVTRVGESEVGWAIVEIEGNYYFVWNEYLSDEPIELPDPEPVVATTKAEATSASTASYSASYFRQMGVINWGGYRWTWYSDNVLSGGGLNIPGRHYDGNNYICDENGYICLASSSLSKGTVIDTPFGKMGKIYDCGCAYDTIDVYVHW